MRAAVVFAAGLFGIQLQVALTPPMSLDALQEYWPGWWADEVLMVLIVALLLALTDQLVAIWRMRRSGHAE